MYVYSYFLVITLQGEALRQELLSSYYDNSTALVPKHGNIKSNNQAPGGGSETIQKQSIVEISLYEVQVWYEILWILW